MKKFQIKGMNCMHCQANATKALKGINGVTDATVDLKTTDATIEGDATEQQIADALQAVGFTAVF